MTVELNHTIVPARDKAASASFLAGFLPITLANDVTLDFMDAADPQPQHYAFLVSEDAFDAAFERIVAAGVAYHAEPNGDKPGETYHSRSGGRGVYFPDPDGHNMEILTCDIAARRV